MKTKTAASTKKQSVTVKDLTTRKNPKGGGGNVIVISGTKTQAVDTRSLQMQQAS